MKQASCCVSVFMRLFVQNLIPKCAYMSNAKTELLGGAKKKYRELYFQKTKR